MKRFYFMLTLALVAMSCEEMPLDEFTPNQVYATNDLEEVDCGKTATRAGSIDTDFSPLVELIEQKVPVNIINVGNAKKTYLSCYSSGGGVILNDKDTGSELERWILSPAVLLFNQRMIHNYGRRTADKICAIGPSDVWSTTSTVAVVQQVSNNAMTPMAGAYFPVPNTDYYQIVHTYSDPNSIISYKSLWLQAENSTSNRVSYKNFGETSMAYWKFVPAGDYEIVDIKYLETATDFSELKKEYGAIRIIENPSAAKVTQNVLISEKVTVSSTIKQPEKIELEISGQVEEPEYDTNGNLNGSSSGTVGNMDFGSTTSYEKTIGDMLSVEIPPYTNIKIETTRFTYNVSATYVANVVSKIYGVQFRIKGKYVGRIFTQVAVKVIDANSGLVLKENFFDSEPQLIVKPPIEIFDPIYPLDTLIEFERPSRPFIKM